MFLDVSNKCSALVKNCWKMKCKFLLFMKKASQNLIFGTSYRKVSILHSTKKKKIFFPFTAWSRDFTSLTLVSRGENWEFTLIPSSRIVGHVFSRYKYWVKSFFFAFHTFFPPHTYARIYIWKSIKIEVYFPVILSVNRR